MWSLFIYYLIRVVQSLVATFQMCQYDKPTLQKMLLQLHNTAASYYLLCVSTKEHLVDRRESRELWVYNYIERSSSSLWNKIMLRPTRLCYTDKNSWWQIDNLVGLYEDTITQNLRPQTDKSLVYRCREKTAWKELKIENPWDVVSRLTNIL